jgi:HEAT repeat protein
MDRARQPGAGGPEASPDEAWLTGDHAATIRRMMQAAPPFRPGATPGELVAEFASGEHRMAAFLALAGRGPDVLPAVRDGLRHANVHVRRWSAVFADNFGDAETVQALVPLLRDPDARVRVWAVHSLSCESCKGSPNPIDAVPLLLERLESDPSLKVRRHAAAMLAYHRRPDARVLPVLRRMAAEATDRKLRLHAENGLARYSRAGTAAE